MVKESQETDAPRKRRRLAVRLLVAAACAVVFLAVLLLSVPFIVTHIPLPELVFDMSEALADVPASMVTNKNVTATVTITRDVPDGFRVRARGMLLDWHYSARAHIRFGFVRADGEAVLTLDGTDWRASGNFGGTSAKDWRFSASIRETEVSHDEVLLGDLLRRVAPQVASNLVFKGRFSLDADGECTPLLPVPAWSASGSLKDVDASFAAGDKTIDVHNMRMRFGAKGLADRMEIAPLFPRADSVAAAGVVLSNAFANVRATERSYLVTEAGADCCGGELRLYSLFLDPERLSAGAAIFVDGVDAGKVLSHVSGFNGEASGRLHGKLPFFLKDGKEIHFRNAYLFSTPGETGKVMVSDAGPILDNLEAGGLPKSERDNLARVLANLDYSVLRVELEREEDGGLSLALKLEGTASEGSTTVPVNLNVTFRGDLDKLIKTGMDISRRQ